MSMKLKIFSTALLLLILGSIVSCNKVDFNYPPGTVGHSSIIYFPSVKITGSQIISIVEGGTYTDPGATATLAGASVPYTVSPTVDVNTPGVYTLTYSAQNPQGYSATDWRME